jgi:hypothetical protein
MTTTPQPGEIVRRSKKFEMTEGPNGQPVISGVTELEWIDGTILPPEEHERRAAAAERRVVRAVEKTAASIASKAVEAAAPGIVQAAIRSFVQALPEPAADVSAADYVRALRAADLRVDAGKIHVRAAHKSA